MSQRDTGRSIFQTGSLDFDLETFASKDFIVKDFIEKLTKEAGTSSRTSGAPNTAFDPKPYIRTFEAALKKLQYLQHELSSREAGARERVRQVEMEHGRRIKTLHKNLEETLQQFSSLDATLGDGGGGATATKIGDQLEKLEKQRQRAVDAKFLIQCFMEFQKGDTSRLEALRKTGRIQDSIQCAQVTSQLMTLAKNLDQPVAGEEQYYESQGINGSGPPGIVSDRTRELIEKYSETLETDLLKQFDRAYRNADLQTMKGCAKVLYDFNGGGSVVALFVNQHDFFIDKGKLLTEEIDTSDEIWEKLPDPDIDPPGLEPSLKSLIDDVGQIIKAESDIIGRVFPNPEEVVQIFIQRVFQQSVQQRLEQVLDRMDSTSPLAFLRTLQSSRAYMAVMVEDLKQHGLTEHPHQIPSGLSLLLDQNSEDLFSQYLEGATSKYIDREKTSLQELYSAALYKFNLYHQKRKQAMHTTMFDRIGKQLKEASTAALEKSISQIQESVAEAQKDPLSNPRKNQLIRLARLDRLDPKTAGDASKNRLSEIEVTEADGSLETATAKRMLKWLAEGVGRSLELSPTGETAKDASALLNLLIEAVGKGYLEMSLDASLDSATAQETSKNEPDISYLATLDPATIIMQLMFTCINTALLPLAHSSLTQRREMNIATSNYLSHTEARISSILQKSIDVIIGWTTTLLSKQRRTDFRPKDEDASLMQVQTPTCQAVVSFLKRAHATALESLSGSNLTLFLAEVVAALRNLLLEHFKKFSVSPPGGFMLTKDVNMYAGLVNGWHLSKDNEPDQGFEVLQELSTLFVIPASGIKERMREGVLAKVKPAFLKPYLMKRDDWASAGVEKMVNLT